MDFHAINIPEPLFNYLDALAASIDNDPNDLAAVLLFVSLAKVTPVGADDPISAFKKSWIAEDAQRRIKQLQEGALPTWLGNIPAPEDPLNT